MTPFSPGAAARTTAALFFLAAACPAQLPPPPAPVAVPRAGKFYADPVTGARVWTVTDDALCPRGAHHYYSYLSPWNADGSHLLVECVGWSRDSSNLLLVRNSDLKVLGDALRSAPDGFNRQRVFWSWKDAAQFYAYRGQEVWRWDPFARKGAAVFRAAGQRAWPKNVGAVRLAYVSFDDRMLLLELQGAHPARPNASPWDVLALATYDLEQGRVTGLLDVSRFSHYDEAVFTKDGHVWVRASDEKGVPASYRYAADFSGRIRVAEGGHHAHGLLPSGIPVAVKEASNRDCPAGSPSGNPADAEYPQKGWKPTAVLLDERVDTTGAGRNDPLRSILLPLGCQVPGQHQFSHFSWNHSGRDFFFVSTGSYGDATRDPLANAIVEVRLRIGPEGRVQSDQLRVLAPHRSASDQGYYAQPRVACNQQGTRCLFSSTMSVGTTRREGPAQLYAVDASRP